MQDDSTCVRIPLHNRAGEIVAYAVVDAIDAGLSEFSWCRYGKGYAARNVWDKAAHHMVRLHREILGLAQGDPRQGDHINGDRLDCRRANLRIVGSAGNGQNVPSQKGTSRYRGVTWDKERGKWLAQVKKDRRNNFLGRFDSEEIAAEVASAFRLAHMPYTNEDRRAT